MKDVTARRLCRRHMHSKRPLCSTDQHGLAKLMLAAMVIKVGGRETSNNDHPDTAPPAQIASSNRYHADTDAQAVRIRGRDPDPTCAKRRTSQTPREFRH
jgi:hypothetical protein